eukprot:TRINITY_DN1232_c4_g1_i1.p1 TRINITY_DN1232_c4_g1~~TRINITY_DN1232_c4_g1_i1.p1  ORF type:complete len:313 (-),score=80.88 TRINITY_DN1232_c4_g1_i1:87-1025(-)
MPVRRVSNKKMGLCKIVAARLRSFLRNHRKHWFNVLVGLLVLFFLVLVLQSLGINLDPRLIGDGIREISDIDVNAYYDFGPLTKVNSDNITSCPLPPVRPLMLKPGVMDTYKACPRRQQPPSPYVVGEEGPPPPGDNIVVFSSFDPETGELVVFRNACKQVRYTTDTHVYINMIEWKVIADPSIPLLLSEEEFVLVQCVDTLQVNVHFRNKKDMAIERRSRIRQDLLRLTRDTFPHDRLTYTRDRRGTTPTTPSATTITTIGATTSSSSAMSTRGEHAKKKSIEWVTSPLHPLVGQAGFPSLPSTSLTSVSS